MGDFERDTRVEGSAGRYRAALSEDWRIWGPNGGYLAAIALRAVGREADIPRPVSFSGHFLSVGRFAPVELAVEAIRRGKRSESFRVRMLQDGKALFEGLARTAAAGPGLEHDVAKMPEVAPPDRLRNAEQIAKDLDLPSDPPFPFWRNLEARPVWPERWAEPPRPREPIFREWLRFRPRDTFDDPWTDAARSLLLIDTMSWPAAVQPHGRDPGFTAPNLDVTAWFHRSAPQEAWLLADHASEVAAGGLMGTTARIWTPGGELLATGGAQLLCVSS